MLAKITATDLNPVPFVTVLHFCRWCREHTRHELRESGMVCVDCAHQVLLRELDRD
jgi:hypothetical protein